jgi:uncharacterized membrane protein YgdD (TMEM256/DUF423 family)
VQLNWLWVLAGVDGLLTVALGAFGAHALKEILGTQGTDWWRTAVLYQGLHVAPLLALSLLPGGGRLVLAASLCFLVGTLLFSGSLYAMALTGVRALGAVTPFGGVALLAGWACLAALGWQRS